MFTTTDVFGRIVSLTSDTWHNHICVGHPELKPYLVEVKKTIEDPILVAKSSSQPDSSQIYFDRPLKRDLYLKVVVDIDQENTGDVATALLQKNLQGAEIPGGVLYVNKNK